MGDKWRRIRCHIFLFCPIREDIGHLLEDIPFLLHFLLPPHTIPLLSSPLLDDGTDG
jgi:hypothetical protein